MGAGSGYSRFGLGRGVVGRRRAPQRAIWGGLALIASWFAAAGCGRTTESDGAGDSSGGVAGLGGAGHGARRTTAVPLYTTGALRGREDAEDTREEAVWAPPIALGSPGWRMSTDSLCFQDPGESNARHVLTSFGVWAHKNHVATSAMWSCAGSACAGSGPTKVRENAEGRGWQIRLQDEIGGRSTPATNQLSGFPRGPLILLNYSTYDFSPSTAPADSVALLHGGWEVTKSTLEPPLGESDAAYAVAAFGVDSFTGYVLIREGEPPMPSSVHRFLEEKWKQVDSIPSSGNGIWADQTRLLVAAKDGLYECPVSQGMFFQRRDAPIAEYTSVWALTEDDVWAGTSHGELVHFDGQSWDVLETGTQSPITRLWGSDGEVFYMNESLLGRFKGGELETLISAWPGLRLWDLGGISAREVFVTLTDEVLANYRCGQRRILWFDGAEFHSF